MADKRRNLGIPSGVVFPFAGATAPYGYLVCDGSEISRSDYPHLFSAIGISHGQGNGSTTFNLPDYRGRFMRGVDGTASNDPDKASRTASAAGGNTGNAVGSVQGHAFQTHNHIQNPHTHDFSGLMNSADAAAVPANYIQATAASTNASSLDVSYVQNTTATNNSASATGATSQVTANETRPVNISVNYIIKV